MRFSYKTKVLFILKIRYLFYLYVKKGYTPSNPNKVNQDSLIISPNVNNNSW